MATATPNIGLTLPVGTENVSRQLINGNWSLIDTEFGKRKEIKRGTFTLNIPSAAQAVMTTIAHISQNVGTNITIVGTEIYNSGNISDLKHFSIGTNVLFNSFSGEVWLVVDVRKASNTSATPQMAVTMRYYYYEN